jgi:hypothetical protein
MSWWRRSDGDLVRDLPLNRRVMPYLMPGRNESVYYFDIDLALHRTDAWLREVNTAHPDLGADVFHLVLWGVRESMVKYPTMNRFVAGGRLYQRREISMAFAVKQRLRDGSPMAVVKRTFPPDEPFGDLVRSVQAQSFRDRFGGPQGIDRELALLMRLPGFGRRLAIGAVRTADRFGLLPRAFVDGDPMFASAFVAHMASFGMPAGYHHLYEYGTTGVFCVVGRPTAVPGSPTSGPDRRRTMRMTYSFDERTEDGFTAWRSIQHFKRLVEDPAAAGLEPGVAGLRGDGVSGDAPDGIASGRPSDGGGGDLRPMGAE